MESGDPKLRTRERVISDSRKLVGRLRVSDLSGRTFSRDVNASAIGARCDRFGFIDTVTRTIICRDADLMARRALVGCGRVILARWHTAAAPGVKYELPVAANCR